MKFRNKFITRHIYVSVGLALVAFILIYACGMDKAFYILMLPMLSLAFMFQWNVSFYELRNKDLYVRRGRNPETIPFNKIQKLVRSNNTGISKFLFGESAIEIHYRPESILKIYPEKMDEFERELRKAAIKAKSKNG